MKPEQLIDELKRRRIPQELIAQALNRSRPVATKLLKGERSLKARDIAPLQELLNDWDTKGALRMVGTNYHAISGGGEIADYDDDYVRVNVLPTFAGMGGGGTGDDPGVEEKALIPRVLVEDMLRGRAKDFLLIRVRGDSMEPDFRHGDELLIDQRDQSPSQPGPFALWDGEWGEYVVKNVERLADGQVRIFSSNSKYTSAALASEQTRIIGRPVWFGRRL